MVKRKNVGIVALTLGLGLVTAACSSSPTTSAPTTGASATSQAVAKAKAELAAYSKVPSFVAPGPPVKAATEKGKLIWVVMHDAFANYLVTAYQGIQAAATTAGLKTQMVNGNGVTSTMQQGVLQGIQAGAAAIILDGIDGALVTPQLEQAKAAHIPVVDVPLISEPNLYDAIDPNVELMGRLMADTAITATGGNATVGIITFNSPIVLPQLTGLKSVLSTCSGCSIVATQDVEPTSWPTSLASTTVNMIRANPQLNVIAPMADSMLPFVVAGVKQAGAAGRVKILSGDGEPVAVQYLLTPANSVIGDPGGSVPWLGWLAVDDSLRAMMGLSHGNETLPMRTVLPSTVAGQKTITWTSLYGDSYISGFKKLWGLG